MREGSDLSNRPGVYPLFGWGEMESLQGSVALVIYLNQYLSDIFWVFNGGIMFVEEFFMKHCIFENLNIITQ